MASGRRSRARRLEARLHRLAPELRRLGDALYRDLPVHVRDQHEAAGREARTLAERIGARMGWRLASGRTSERLSALLATALALRVRTSCPHARRGPVLGDLTWISLSSGWIACRRCLPASVAADPRIDDGRCDLCDEPAPRGVFTEHLLHVGPVLWHFNVGECCERLLQAALAGGGPE